MKQIIDIKAILASGGKIRKGKGPHEYELLDKDGKHKKWVSKKDFNNLSLNLS